MAIWRIEGKLSKAPSIRTRRVDVIRRYERVAGVRVLSPSSQRRRCSSPDAQPSG
jgi:hypothetical protein